MAKTKSVAQLRKELAAKERQIDRLKTKRAKVAGELERLDKQIARLSGKPAASAKSGGKKGAPKKRATKKRAKKKRHRRPKNKAGLADTLAQVLKGKEGVSIEEAVDLVRKAGYKTTSKNLRGLVGQRLSGDDRFKSVDRGVYALKG